MRFDRPATDALSILRDERRRRLLAILRRHEDRMTVRDAAYAVVVRERDAPITEVPSSAVAEVYVSLVHVHLPLLAAADLVEFDPERYLVAPTDRIDEFPPSTARASGADRRDESEGRRRDRDRGRNRNRDRGRDSDSATDALE